MIPWLALCVFASVAAAMQAAEPPLSKMWSVVLTNQSSTTAALSHDGQWLAVAGRQNVGNQIQIRRAADGAWVKTLPGHDGNVIALEFSKDGTLLASSGRDEQLKLWSVAEGKLIGALANIVSAQSGQGGAMAFSPEDSLLVSTLKTTPTNLAVWHMRKEPSPKPEFLYSLAGHTNGVYAIDFSPDGKFMATGGGFRGQDLRVKIWNPLSGELIKTLQTSNTYGIDDVKFSPDGKILATGTDDLPGWAGNVELWNTTDWTLLRRLPGKGFRLAFSPDGEFLVALRDRSRMDLWRVATGTMVRSYAPPSSEFGTLATVDFTPDGNSLIIAGFNNGGAVPLGYLNRVRFPGRELEARFEEDAIELSWLLSGARLQKKTDLNADWGDLPAPEAGVSRVTMDKEGAGFFRVVGGGAAN
jgi:WD40 repeat protein